MKLLVAQSCPTLGDHMDCITLARPSPLSVDSSRQEHWGGLPVPCPGDPPHPGMDPRSLAVQADFAAGATKEALYAQVT